MESKREALTTAISADDLGTVRLLLDGTDKFFCRQVGQDLNDVHVGPYDYRANRPRFPLLHFAARQGSISVLKYLIEERGLNRDKFTKSAGTPLSRAVHSSRVECVRYLVDEAGCDVNRKVPVCQVRECRVNLVTPLMIAVSREQPDIVRVLLDSGRCHVNATAGFRETALYFALKHATHFAQYTQMLLAAGVRPDIKSTTDEPPLLLALKLGRVDVARTLIAHGCDVNATMESPASFGLTALHVAAEMNDVDLVKCIVEAGANLEARTNADATLGTTPLLHCAAGNRSYNALAALLDGGADVTATDKFGRNVVHWLVLNGDDHPLSFLLAQFRSRIDLEKLAADGHDTTPLDYAIVTNNAPATRLLLSYNCKLRSMFRQHCESPVDFVAKRGFNELLPCLWQAGSQLTAELVASMSVDGGRRAGIHPALRHNVPLLTWLKMVSARPRSLLDLSRLAIRDNMGTNIGDDVKRLEIPRILQRFIVNIETGI